MKCHSRILACIYEILTLFMLRDSVYSPLPPLFCYLYLCFLIVFICWTLCNCHNDFSLEHHVNMYAQSLPLLKKGICHKHNLSS